MKNYKVKKLNHIFIPVSSLEQSLDFYTNILGFTEDFKDEVMAGLHFGEEGNVCTVMLHIADHPEPVEHGIVIELAVENLENCLAAVKPSKGRIVQQATERPWGVREAVICDPDGYRFWLVEPIPDQNYG